MVLLYHELNQIRTYKWLLKQSLVLEHPIVPEKCHWYKDLLTRHDIMKLHAWDFDIEDFSLRLCEEREVRMYCDLHGHSRKQNVFTYGCARAADNQLHERVFPFMLSKNCPDMVSSYNEPCEAFTTEWCRFKIMKELLYLFACINGQYS